MPEEIPSRVEILRILRLVMKLSSRAEAASREELVDEPLQPGDLDFDGLELVELDQD